MGEKHFALGGWAWRSCCWNKHGISAVPSAETAEVSATRSTPAPRPEPGGGVVGGRGGAGGGADGGRKPGSRSD